MHHAHAEEACVGGDGFSSNWDGTHSPACTVCGETITETMEAPAEVPAVEEAAPVNAELVAEEPEEVVIDEEVLQNVPGTVEKAFEVTLIVEGNGVQPGGQVKVKIPVKEKEIEQMEGKVLMLHKADGTLVGVEFEIVGSELVFPTDELGGFILMDVSEMEQL